MLHGQWMAAAFLTLPLMSLVPAAGRLTQTTSSFHSKKPVETRGAQTRSGTELQGIVTTRLSEKNLSRWKEIEQIVFAETADRQPLHPTLRGMWEWLETSGHTI